MHWDVTGRMPEDHELSEFKHFAHDDIGKALPFIDNISAKTSFDVSSMLLSGGSDNTHIGMKTTRPLALNYNRAKEKGTIEGSLRIDPITGNNVHLTQNNLAASLDLNLEFNHLLSFTLDQQLQLAPFNIDQKLTISSQSITPFLRDYFNTGNYDLEKLNIVLSTSIENTVPLQLNSIFDNLDFTGKLYLEGRGEISAAKSLKATGIFKTDAVTVNFNDMQLNDVNSDLIFEKIYSFKKDNSHNEFKGNSAFKNLSQEILLEQAPGDFHPNDTFTNLSKMFSNTNQSNIMTFEHLEIGNAISKKEIDHFLTSLLFDKGLPRAEKIQFEFLGGSILSNFKVQEHAGDFFLEVGVYFSNINASKLLPEIIGQIKEDTSVNGQITFSIPIVSEIDSLLSNLNANLVISHIGPRALERILYSLDPLESNEAIINQRRLLENGTPTWIKTSVDYGNLSINGEVLVKGVTLPLPKVERVNLANLSGLKSIDLSKVTVLKKILLFLSSEHINLSLGQKQ